MAAFLFRCPRTNLNVQGFVADDPADDRNGYEPVQCMACTRTHYVDPKTGKVLGEDE